MCEENYMGYVLDQGEDRRSSRLSRDTAGIHVRDDEALVSAAGGTHAPFVKIQIQVSITSSGVLRHTNGPP